MNGSSIENTIANIRSVYIGRILRDFIHESLATTTKEVIFIDDFHSYIQQQTFLSLPDLVLIAVDENPDWAEQVAFIRHHPILKHLVIVLIGTTENAKWRERALQLRVNDYYVHPFPKTDFISRIGFLIKFKAIHPNIMDLSMELEERYKMPLSKRLFDIIASGTALFFLSPIFILIGILIKLESKGPIVYKSKRVGAGYQIFDFYKFRSMRSDADKMIGELSSLNQYANEGNKNGKSAFVKFANDPRITRLGKILRKTSVDELPQLINVFIGDMSLVGNRPLPLYEAEQLTTNKWSSRFNGPAGLTGLWQISRRGKKDMSESERKELDNYYANHYSIFLDFKIILKTIPALIQKEEV
ncbi:sugar transferase [Pedobacter sandarakinus]|uniref:sugar transferase n=1 Tax=Pedobacter sandarakinus TaxID=353156 RepID=UPI002245ED9E|nr:sugar transferase [Pedobacter sandarakinus]MCX2574871.1 sugar transferase [Pedobacter sandarakinus]